jgi:hypothetical protein
MTTYTEFKTFADVFATALHDLMDTSRLSDGHLKAGERERDPILERDLPEAHKRLAAEERLAAHSEGALDALRHVVELEIKAACNYLSWASILDAIPRTLVNADIVDQMRMTSAGHLMSQPEFASIRHTGKRRAVSVM